MANASVTGANPDSAGTRIWQLDADTLRSGPWAVEPVMVAWSVAAGTGYGRSARSAIPETAGVITALAAR
jgi:hypothetical protein